MGKFIFLPVIIEWHTRMPSIYHTTVDTLTLAILLPIMPAKVMSLVSMLLSSTLTAANQGFLCYFQQTVTSTLALACFFYI